MKVLHTGDGGPPKAFPPDSPPEVDNMNRYFRMVCAVLLPALSFTSCSTPKPRAPQDAQVLEYIRDTARESDNQQCVNVNFHDAETLPKTYFLNAATSDWWKDYQAMADEGLLRITQVQTTTQEGGKTVAVDAWRVERVDDKWRELGIDMLGTQVCGGAYVPQAVDGVTPPQEKDGQEFMLSRTSGEVEWTGFLSKPALAKLFVGAELPDRARRDYLLVRREGYWAVVPGEGGEVKAGAEPDASAPATSP